MSTEAADLPATVVLNKADLVPAEECSQALAEVCLGYAWHAIETNCHAAFQSLQI